HVLPAARRIIRDLGQRYGVQAWRSPKVLSTLSPHFTWTDLLAKWSGEDPMLAPHFLLSLHQWGDRLLDDQRLQAVLSKPGTVTELVVHPGYAPDPDLPLPDQLLPEHRQAEVDFITGPAFRHWLEELGVVLIGFGDLVYVHG
ncbi:MAG: ChbG/HpnK family deacetylase, partial [Anaerolineae bacterium]|nr:ChbG/HpnK family deacetylase [Anaerolineae bacterium]